MLLYVYMAGNIFLLFRKPMDTKKVSWADECDMMDIQNDPAENFDALLRMDAECQALNIPDAKVEAPAVPLQKEPQPFVVMSTGGHASFVKEKKIKYIAKITFGVKSAEEIRKQAVCKVSDITIYNKNKPRNNAINDHRMGTVDRRIPCGTCKHNVEVCSGHTGYIELAVALYNVGFLDTVINILRSVCYFCSALALPPDAPQWERWMKLSPGQRFEEVKTFSQTKRNTCCWRCGGARPDYKRLSSKITIGIVRTWPPGTEFEDVDEEGYATQPFTASLAREILETISDEDCTRMGIDVNEARPENYITTNLLVPPPCIRPAIMVSEGSRAKGQDDLTRKLQDILKKNIEVAEKLKKHKFDLLNKEVAKVIDEMQYHYAVYLNNDLKGIKADTQRSGAPIRSITQRIRGKGGLIRTNLMGKRVDFSARSVISPDPTLDVDQLAVPLLLATQLTYPVRVTAQNIEEMTKRVINGSGRVDGAFLIEYPDGRKKHLSNENKRHLLHLPLGAVVHRYLQNDDYVIFNRHPSLHKQSLMGHRVKIKTPEQGNTFSMSLVVTTPYNADFDGKRA